MPTKPMIDERMFIPETIDQARDLYSALVAADVSVAQAKGIVSWLIVLPDRRSDDPCSNALRRDYRKALMALGEPPWPPSKVREDKGVYLISLSERRSLFRFDEPGFTPVDQAA